MHRGRGIGVVFVVLLALFAPTMACAFPNSRMTAEEHSCCRQMKGKCESMKMPASHSCCGKGMQAGEVEALQPKAALLHPVITLVFCHPAAVMLGAPVAYQSTDCWAPSPAASPPGRIGVLRI